MSGIREVFHLPPSPSRALEEARSELQLHFDMRVAELIAEGVPEAAARARALDELGGDMEEVARTLRTIDAQHLRRNERASIWYALRDATRDALRQLPRQKALSFAIVLTLGLGIGANAAMFNVVDNLLLRLPAGIRSAEEVGRLYVTRTLPWGPVNRSHRMSYVAYDHVARTHAAELSPYAVSEVSFGRGLEARRITQVSTGADWFRLMGVTAASGRLLGAEDASGDAHTAVLANEFWRTVLAGAPVIGKDIEIANQRYTVVGITPPGFVGLDDAADVFVPLETTANATFGPAWRTADWIQWFQVATRVEQGREPRAVNEELSRLLRSGEDGLTKDVAARAQIGPIPLARGLTGSEIATASRVSLWLSFVSLLVVVAACVNAATLLIARQTRRERELGVRLALGVRRTRLVADAVAQAGVLTALGALAGLALAWWFSAILRSVLLAPDTASAPWSLTWRLVAYVAVVGVVVIVLTLLPVLLRTLRADAMSLLRAGTASKPGRVAGALVVAQAALGVVMVSGAALFVTSLHNAANLDNNVDTHHVVVARWDPGSMDVSQKELVALYSAALERVKSLPGVEAAALSVAVPFVSSFAGPVALPEGPLPDMSDAGPYVSPVSADYMRVMGTRILTGRDFDNRDNATSERVALVSQSAARIIWPGSDPIGKCLVLGRQTERPCTRVIGVVATPARMRILETHVAQIWVPLEQNQIPTFGCSLVIRSRRDAESIARTVHDAMQGTAPNLPYLDVQPLDRKLDTQLRTWRIGAGVFTAFGILVLALVIIGLYSVTALTVASQTREFGVRFALGSSVYDVLRLVLRDAIVRALSGLLAGAIVFALFARALQSMLFGVTTADPRAWGIVGLVLILATLLASAVPALRAARVSPSVAIREG